MNQNNILSLLGKIEYIRKETEKIRNEWEAIIEEKIQNYENKLKLAQEAKKHLLTELNAIYDMCNDIIDRLDRPVFKKDFYTPLEYLMTTKNDIKSILDEIKPPKIEELKPYGKFKKIDFYSTTLCHLLNNYNSYCIYLADVKINEQEVTSLHYFDGNHTQNVFGENFDDRSRIMLVSPNEVLMTGGSIEPKRCLLIDLSTKTMKKQADLNFERYWHCCAFIMGCPGVIGGNFNGKLTTVEIFKNKKWEQIASLNHPRSGATASKLFEKVYVFGGGYNSPVEVFNENDTIWHELKCEIFQTPTACLGLVSLFDDFLLIFGGVHDNTNFHDNAYKVDLNSGITTQIVSVANKGKCSYNSHIVRDNFLMSFKASDNFTGIEQWKINQEIKFAYE